MVIPAVDESLLVLRLALGGMLAAHGLNKVLGPGGLAGTTRWFAALGLRPAWLHARLAALTEVGAGLLMAAGLLTPLAGAAFAGLMLVAAVTDHRGKGFFVFEGGWEYAGLVGLTALCVTGTGPGRWSLDAVLGWELSGARWAGIALAAGLAAAAALLVTAQRPASGARQQ
ncbi:MAG: DoxX family protein [Pseudonocardia sp.]|uniref:DoxX family protein n=1 Tax=unclassified Pseudonocardia TaxID=2619320 RepID=UPI00086D4F98|nr:MULTISPECIES: DoxX family protein [unclassified Pseudonocardia]MBN9112209.1 DoxX family protein [Pseudonocardia sp.]ODU30145.1 MAG: DoxX family protein [Pseudonocardia sp. SCN 72-51]ODV03069.1 MAG: DoxX family protein [Pseudonocardia sp. SCN 73-27]